MLSYNDFVKRYLLLNEGGWVKGVGYVCDDGSVSNPIDGDKKQGGKTDDEIYQKRKETMDKYWEKELEKVAPKEKDDVRSKREIVNKLFSKENWKENEEKLKKYGLTGEEIKNISLGKFTPKGKLNQYPGKEKPYHFHITKTGGKGSTSDDVVIYYKSNGKIDKIVPHDVYLKNFK